MKKRQAKKRTPATIKRETVISAATLKHSANSRFSPLRGLSAADLTRYIESFEAGDFLRLADTMAAMERRDYTWKIAAAKARKDVSCRQWQCVPKDGYKDDPDAAAQADALRAFYSSIKVTDYRCKNVYSGVRGLVSNIMYAYNDEYSLQEIVFTPTAAGKLSAHIMRCPLGWFQLMDGYMHLRPQIASTESEELEDGGWIISKSDGVGIACAVAYQFKRMSLGDLAIYSGRCGQPGIQGKTNATYGSTEWNNMAEAVRNFKNEWSAVTGLNDIFEAIDLSLSGTLPQPIIIELMDRAIASLQRGADLSTMSAGVGSGEGASLQGEESLLITTDNCAMVSETLQTQLDPFVIAWHFGPDTEIKAGFELIPPKNKNVTQDLLTDEKLTSMGVRISKNATLERYNRTEADPADPDDSPLTAPSSPAALVPTDYSFANEAQTSTGSPAPVSKTDTPADRDGSPGIHDPAAAIINRAAAAILDGSTPFDQAIAAAIAELEKLPNAAADLPDTLEKTLTEAMFTQAAQSIEEKS